MALASIHETPTLPFDERFMQALNGGALMLMSSIGHRTGLFDTMAEMRPATAEAIARAAGLNERYVREWLGAMVVSGVVEVDPESGVYELPAEHAAFLTRSAAPNNLAAFAQYIGQLGAVEDGIVDCFRNGGGLPYSAFKRFHEIMADDSGQTVLPALIDHILPLVPGLTERLQAGIDVLDVGCGRGRALNLLARTFPNSRFTGFDFSDETIDYARNEARENGSTNVRFLKKDAAHFLDTEAFDLICTFDAVHDQADPLAVVSNIRRALRPDGVYLMQDIHGHTHHHDNIDHPMGTLLYTVSCMHCMTVSLAEGGAGLGAMWGVEQATDLLRRAGFRDIEVHQLEHDVQNDYYIIRK
jgi:SAM-dependent methyltransferase